MTFAAFLLLAAFADPASGSENGSAAASVEQVKPKKEKKICKRIESSVSRMGSERICKTAQEWRSEGSEGTDGQVRGRSLGN